MLRITYFTGLTIVVRERSIEQQWLLTLVEGFGHNGNILYQLLLLLNRESFQNTIAIHSRGWI